MRTRHLRCDKSPVQPLTGLYSLGLGRCDFDPAAVCRLGGYDHQPQEGGRILYITALGEFLESDTDNDHSEPSEPDELGGVEEGGGREEPADKAH